MNFPSAPSGPAWLGWALFAVSLVGWMVHLRLKTRTDMSQARKNDMETIRGHLELLRLSTDSSQAHIDAISRALSSDSEGRPSVAELTALQEGLRGPGLSIVSHLLSREKARAEMPRAIARLHEVQRRRLHIEEDIQAGLRVNSEELIAIRQELGRLSKDLSALIEEIAESPRVYVSEAPPASSRDGDLWIQMQSN